MSKKHQSIVQKRTYGNVRCKRTYGNVHCKRTEWKQNFNFAIIKGMGIFISDKARETPGCGKVSCLPNSIPVRHSRKLSVINY